MTPRRMFMSLAAEHGIQVEYAPGSMSCYRLELIAPDGFIFRSSGSMFDCSLNGWDGDAKHAPWRELIRELDSIITAGFDPAEEE